MSTFTLTVNDPRTGWAHSTDHEFETLDAALAQVKLLRDKTPRLRFAIQYQNKTYMQVKGRPLEFQNIYGRILKGNCNHENHEL